MADWYDKLFGLPGESTRTPDPYFQFTLISANNKLTWNKLVRVNFSKSNKITSSGQSITHSHSLKNMEFLVFNVIYLNHDNFLFCTHDWVVFFFVSSIFSLGYFPNGYHEKATTIIIFQTLYFRHRGM